MSLTLTSPSFPHGGMIPLRHTCEGHELSPQLVWSGTPANTQSLALIVDDPDAPDPQAPKMTWVHWVLYNIPPHATELAESIASNKLPAGTLPGLNDWKRIGYGGPCPPVGTHRYFHKLFALEKAMQGHVLAQAELIGLYQKRA